LKDVYLPQFIGVTRLFAMSSFREFFLNLAIGIAFLVSALILASSSVSLRSFGFGLTSFLEYDPYLELLAFVSVGVGGFFVFRAGQVKPASHAPARTLIEQVKDVIET
jgi:hypothetical protein